MAYPQSCEGWGGPSAIGQLELAQRIVRRFPRDLVAQTGIPVRQTAYAVASAESGRDPFA